MTDTEINIAIAEVCGWKNCHCETLGNMPVGEPDDDYNRDVLEHRKHGQCGYPTQPHLEPIPEYVNDLNAMPEALSTLTPGGRVAYMDHIKVVTLAVYETENPQDQFDIHTASASQRAEAFLRTVGKWKECSQPSDEKQRPYLWKDK
jgi:hypothetical protein